MRRVNILYIYIYIYIYIYLSLDVHRDRVKSTDTIRGCNSGQKLLIVYRYFRSCLGSNAASQPVNYAQESRVTRARRKLFFRASVRGSIRRLSLHLRFRL